MSDRKAIQSYHIKNSWAFLVTCFIFITLIDFFGQVIFRKTLPNSSEFFLSQFPGVFAYLIPALYFSYRCGNIKSADIIPKGPDFVMLFVGLIFVFMQASLVALLSPLETYTIHGKSLSQLPRIEIFLILFSSLVVGPFFEEILFRKYILEILKQNYTTFFAVIAVSLLETFIHIGFRLDLPIDLFRFIRFFIFFSALSFIYLKSNLGISFVTHSLINTTVLFLTWR